METVINWPPTDYIVVKSRIRFDAQIELLLNPQDHPSEMDRKLTIATNKNYRKIIREIKDYLIENGENVPARME